MKNLHNDYPTIFGHFEHQNKKLTLVTCLNFSGNLWYMYKIKTKDTIEVFRLNVVIQHKIYHIRAQ